MTINNYFKAIGIPDTIVCFDDTDPEDTARAYDEILRHRYHITGHERPLSVWRAPRLRGAWSWLPRISGAMPIYYGPS